MTTMYGLEQIRSESTCPNRTSQRCRILRLYPGIGPRGQLLRETRWTISINTKNPLSLVAEFGDPMGQPGYLAARRFLVDDAGASRPHESGLGCNQSGLCGSLVSAR